MKIDALVCEIGSTTTTVNAFDIKNSRYLGQGVFKTTIDTDVTIGVENAIEDLKRKLNVEEIIYTEMFATSSAAGGLKMTVHGLVHDMTATAAFEAAIGAGANIQFLTSGKMYQSDIDKIVKLKPNIILLAGGVDFGERECALYNAKLIAKLKLNIPVIYAGNCQNIEDIKAIFEEYDQINFLKITENVYPKIDQLNVEPTRLIIHDTFEEHIIHAKGMEKIGEYVTEKIIPTPGAVLKASELLYDKIGDLLCFDVGGATTDLHSVSEGSEEYNKILVNAQPKSKRTVEGDLGVFVNLKKVIEYIGEEKLEEKLNLTQEQLKTLIEEYQVFPKNELETKLVTQAAIECVATALKRHSGTITNQYLSSGTTQIAQGKDLTAVKSIICTGGALTKLETRKEIIESIFELKTLGKMYPSSEVEILYDNNYIMASVGVLSTKYPEEALKILFESFK